MSEHGNLWEGGSLSGISETRSVPTCINSLVAARWASKAERDPSLMRSKAGSALTRRHSWAGIAGSSVWILSEGHSSPPCATRSISVLPMMDAAGSWACRVWMRYFGCESDVAKSLSSLSVVRPCVVRGFPLLQARSDIAKLACKDLHSVERHVVSHCLDLTPG